MKAYVLPKLLGVGVTTATASVVASVGVPNGWRARRGWGVVSNIQEFRSGAMPVGSNSLCTTYGVAKLT